MALEGAFQERGLGVCPQQEPHHAAVSAEKGQRTMATGKLLFHSKCPTVQKQWEVGKILYGENKCLPFLLI